MTGRAVWLPEPPPRNLLKWAFSFFRQTGFEFAQKMRQNSGSVWIIFAQQLINGHCARLDLRPDRHRLHHGLWQSVGMINFAHGDIFMIGGFISR